jgi:hypothetical protein
MTIEQYGHGSWVVRAETDDYTGTFRFETREEAIAERDRLRRTLPQGRFTTKSVRLYRSRKASFDVPVAELGRNAGEVHRES